MQVFKAVSSCFDMGVFFKRHRRRFSSADRLEEKRRRAEAEAAQRRTSKQIDRELKQSSKLIRGTIKLLILGTGESGKSTLLKQARIMNTSTYSIDERRAQIFDIKQNISDAICSILSNMEALNVRLTSEYLVQLKYLIMSNLSLFGRFRCDQSTNGADELWDAIEQLWKSDEVKECAKHGNMYNLIDNAEYFLDRVSIIRRADYLPSDQDILRCRSVTTGITDTSFTHKRVNFRIFDVGGQRDQRRKWIQCFNQVTAIIYVVDVSSFNMTLREDPTVNRLRESIESFRQIWTNRYLYHISIILFLNKFDLLVKKLVQDGCKLEHYFPEFESYKMPAEVDKNLIVPNEDARVTRAKLFIRDQFISITQSEPPLDFSAIHTSRKSSNSSNSAQHSDDNSMEEEEAHRKGSVRTIASFPTPNVEQSSSSSPSSSSPSSSPHPPSQQASASMFRHRASNASASSYFSKSQEMSGKLKTMLNTALERKIQEAYLEMERKKLDCRFCLSYFTCAVDTVNMTQVFDACGDILKQEHLVKLGLL